MRSREKKPRKRVSFWLIILFFCSGLLLVSGYSHLEKERIAVADNANANASVQYEPCLPRSGVKSATVLARVTYRGNTYVWSELVMKTWQEFNGMEAKPVEEMRTTVIEVDANGCSVIFPVEKSMRNSLTLFMPEELANLLALEKMKNAIARYGGKEQLLKAYESVAVDGGTGPWIFFPEDARAFQKLGMRLPKGAVVAKTWEEVGY